MSISKFRCRTTAAVTIIHSAADVPCTYCQRICGDGTIRYKGIATCEKCFLSMARLFFEKDFDLIQNSGDQNIGFD